VKPSIEDLLVLKLFNLDNAIANQDFFWPVLSHLTTGLSVFVAL